MAFALAAALWKKQKGWIYTAFALFVAFTRVYLGVHTLVDVSGGMVLGVLGYLFVGMAWEKTPEGLKRPFSSFLE